MVGLELNHDRGPMGVTSLTVWVHLSETVEHRIDFENIFAPGMPDPSSASRTYIQPQW